MEFKGRVMTTSEILKSFLGTKTVKKCIAFPPDGSILGKELLKKILRFRKYIKTDSL